MLFKRHAPRRLGAAIRRQGWAIADSELIEGYSAAAAAIFNWDGRNIAALAMTLPRARFSPSVRKKYIALPVNAAAEISCILKKG